MREFSDRFRFSSPLAGYVGVERESFILRNGVISPLAGEILESLADSERFGYELSACQLEDRTPPVRIGNLLSQLTTNDLRIGEVERELGFSRLFQEVGPEDIPLDIFPDPLGRYQEIAKSLRPEILRAACRVTGTHVHIGMPDHTTALRVYNGALPFIPHLCFMGDGSRGERLRLYAMMAGSSVPRPYEDWADFYHEAQTRGFESDPRKNWDIIRISVHGTLEFRMFGATNDRNKIVGWAERCLRICESFF